MKKNKSASFFLILTFALFSVSLAFSKEDSSKISIPKNLFNAKLSDSDKKTLESGEVLFESIGNLKNIKVNENQKTKQSIDVIRKLNPNHLSEIIQIRPYKGNENLVERIAEVLGDVKNYVGIPYYSERNQKWYDLYSEAEILSIKKEKNTETIEERFYMKPFGYYTSEIKIENRGDYYFFTMKNTEKLRYYDKFDAVGNEKMQAAIVVFREGDSWVIYALGGARIIDVPFLVKRAETSFTNRIKAFTTAIFKKLEEM